LRLVWRKEVGGVIFEAVQKGNEGLANSIICIVRRLSAAKGESSSHLGFILIQDGEDRLDTWAWRCGDNLGTKIRMTIAD
jgi:hypothetical protein